jgi:hypothetical protein
MRHKLIAVGDDAERVAAYPPIAGFSDPPYYVGLRPPPIPDADYDLWSVRIEDVTARVSELWVMEYRFRGDGVARGSFVVRPARWVQVAPAELVFERGSLTLGAHRVAEQLRGKLTCDIPDMRVQETEGLGVLRDLSATARLELSGGELDFLRAYLAHHWPIRYAGRADWRVDVNLQRGQVERGSRISLRATPLRLGLDDAELAGDWMFHFGRDLESSPDELALAWSSPSVVATRSARALPPLELRGVAGSARFFGVDLKQPLELGELRFGVADASAPSLAWFDTEGARWSGKARAAFELLRQRGGAVSGTARLDAPAARMQRGDLSIGADVSARLGFSRAAGDDAPFQFEQLNLALADARLRHGAKRSDPFSVTFDGAGLRVAPPRASGVVRVQLSSMEALLPLLVS